MIYHLRQFPVHVALLEPTAGLERADPDAMHKPGCGVNITNPPKQPKYIPTR